MGERTRLKGVDMRAMVTALLLGFGLLAATAAPSVACPFHDQQASSDAQRQTAQAQPPQSSQSSTQ